MFALLPAEVQLLALKLTVVSPVQSEKAELPMEVTELGIVTDDKLLQPLKASTPIEVTELGIVTDVNPVNP